MFAIHHEPGDVTGGGMGVVFFAPFAEEMNRARRMATLLGESLSRIGIGMLIFDYAGTGDSDGAFGEFGWDDWAADGLAAIRWMQDRHAGPVVLVGLRMGAALATRCAEQVPEFVPHVVLWQPLVSGEMSLTQFLRIRIASGLSGSSSAQKETTSSLRNRLAAGESLEIAGYRLSPDIARNIAAISLAQRMPAQGCRFDWLEVATGEPAELMPSSLAVIAKWRDRGVNVVARAVHGDQFWATQEMTVAPGLVKATVAALSERRP